MKSLIVTLIFALAICISWAFIYFIGKANYSLNNATRNKSPLSTNARYVKIVLIATVMMYGLVLVIFLVKNSGLKRSISIESKTEHGVLVINQVKYPTYFQSAQASVIYQVDNPIAYLFLDCDIFGICYADALLRLVIVLLVVVFLWRFNFDQPFQWKYYNAARVIWRLVLFVAVLEIVTNMYSSAWVRRNLNDANSGSSSYKYIGENWGVSSLIIFVIVIGSLFYLYGQAVKNREEIDLTI